MAGREVYRSTLDQKMGDTIIKLRDAFDDVEAIFQWLAAHPSNSVDGDILTTPQQTDPNDPMSVTGFGYNADEAYLIRSTFENLHALNVQPILGTARQLTGLE